MSDGLRVSVCSKRGSLTGTFRVVNKPFDLDDISALVAQAFIASRRRETH
jgi:hypothetical protein